MQFETQVAAKSDILQGSLNALSLLFRPFSETFPPFVNELLSGLLTISVDVTVVPVCETPELKERNTNERKSHTPLGYSLPVVTETQLYVNNPEACQNRQNLVWY